MVVGWIIYYRGPMSDLQRPAIRRHVVAHDPATSWRGMALVVRAFCSLDRSNIFLSSFWDGVATSRIIEPLLLFFPHMSEASPDSLHFYVRKRRLHGIWRAGCDDTRLIGRRAYFGCVGSSDSPRSRLWILDDTTKA